MTVFGDECQRGGSCVVVVLWSARGSRGSGSFHFDIANKD